MYLLDAIPTSLHSQFHRYIKFKMSSFSRIIPFFAPFEKIWFFLLSFRCKKLLLNFMYFWNWQTPPCPWVLYATTYRQSQWLPKWPKMEVIASLQMSLSTTILLLFQLRFELYLIRHPNSHFNPTVSTIPIFPVQSDSEINCTVIFDRERLISGIVTLLLRGAKVTGEIHLKQGAIDCFV